MMNLKRKSPSLKSKSKSSMSSGTNHGKAKKKQRSLMGFSKRSREGITKRAFNIFAKIFCFA